LLLIFFNTKKIIAPTTNNPPTMIKIRAQIVRVFLQHNPFSQQNEPAGQG
jgi:hypothetical protein